MQKKEISFNKPQMRLMVNKYKESVSIWSRATGKSTIIAWLMRQVAMTMPRSSWAIVGQTYKQILTRTLPSTIAGLERLGFVQGKHYLIGRKPPEKWGWPLPYEPPLDYSHYITFYTGAGFHIVSLNGGGGSSRGLNIDGYLCDESLLIDREKLNTDVNATNRGNLRYFEHVPIHHGGFHFSSMPYPGQAEWLLDNGDYYKEANQDIIYKRDQLIKLQLDFIQHKDKKYRLNLWPKIAKLNQEIKYWVSKEGMLYSEANIFDNIQNVGIEYIEQQYREMLDYLFQVEVLNKRPLEIDGGFYPLLDYNYHCYQDQESNLPLEHYGVEKEVPTGDCRHDTDLIPTQPIRVAVDFGDRISCASVGQHLQSINEYRMLKDFYVKHPKLVDDLADEIINYYKHHQRKEIVFIQDNEYGNRKGPNSKISYNEGFTKRLRNADWKVKILDLGRIPDHEFRYKLWHDILKEDPKANLPHFTFNLVNTSNLLLSMKMAPVTQRRGRIHKDKSSENNKNKNQVAATHFSDTADLHAVSAKKYLMTKGGIFIPNGF